MSERKFNREQNDTEPVKFKPLYLIIGVCAVVIMISACAIYFLLNEENAKENNSLKTENANKEEITEEYVIPENACVKDVTTSSDISSEYLDCEMENVVLNFSDINLIIDMQKQNENFQINGIYYDKQKVNEDSFLSFTFNKIQLALSDNNIAIVLNDASMQKKSLLYILKDGKVIYSKGESDNTVFALTNPIKYATYDIVDLDCLNASKTDVVYKYGSIQYDGTNYTEIFEKNYLVSDVCKAN